MPQSDEPEPDVHDRRRAVADLGAALRDLALAAVVSEVPIERLEHATALAQELAAVLRERTRPADVLPSVDDLPNGFRFFGPGIGTGSAVSPPLTLEHTPDGVVGRVTLDRRFEGPVGFVHGGVTGLLLDELLGQTEIDAGRWGMTARLSITYRRPLPLDEELVLVGRLAGEDGRKTYITGTIATAAEPDRICVSAEGLFVIPSEATYGRYFGTVTDATGAVADVRFGRTSEPTG